MMSVLLPKPQDNLETVGTQNPFQFFVLSMVLLLSPALGARLRFDLFVQVTNPSGVRGTGLGLEIPETNCAKKTKQNKQNPSTLSYLIQ
jgi:hypothetical protein